MSARSASPRREARPASLDRFGIKGRQPHIGAARRFKAERRPQEADRRADPGARRHQQTLHAELLAEAARMQWRRTAEGDHRVLRKILAVLDSVHARGVGHVLVDHLRRRRKPPPSASNAQGRRRHRRAQSRFGPAPAATFNRAASEVVRDRADRATKSASVTRRPFAAATITGRVRAPIQRFPAPRGSGASTVDMGEGAAACADLDHVDHRDRDRHAGALLEPVGSARLQTVRLVFGVWSLIRQIFAVVPPMSKLSALSTP